MTICYILASILLFILNVFSSFQNGDLDILAFLYYLETICILMISSIVIHLIWRTKKDLRSGLLIALLLANFGAAIAYQMNSPAKMYSQSYTRDTVILLCVFILTYLIFRFTVLYKRHFINLILVAALPTILALTRLFGEKTGGGFVTFFGITIMSIVLLGYPFACAYFLRTPCFWNKPYKEYATSHNWKKLLIYSGVLCLGSIICNEYSTLLIIWSVFIIIHIFYGENIKNKIIFPLASVIAFVIACCVVQHLHDRAIIWITPLDAGKNLEGQAQTVLYLFQTIRRSGIWGNGLGSLPQSLYRTKNTDHVAATLLNEYGLAITIIIILIICLLVAL